MASYDAQAAAALVADPRTPPQVLADIAGQHPGLWDRLKQHPNIYPELAQWIDQARAAQAPAATPAAAAETQPQPAASADPEAQQPQTQPTQQLPDAAPQFQQAAEQQAAEQQATPAYAGHAGYPAQAGYPDQPGYAPQQGYGYPQAAPPRKSKAGLIIGIVAAGVVVLAGIGVALAFAFGAIGGGGSASLADGMRSIEAPEGEFTLEIIDGSRLEEAIGEPFPRNGSQSEIDDWLELAYDRDDERVAVGNIAEPDGLAAVIFEGRGEIWLNDRETSVSVSAFPRQIPDSRLTELLGEPSRGLWELQTSYDEDEFSLFFTQVDGTTYSSAYTSDLPRERPETRDSLASDESVMQMLSLLEKTGGYAYTIERDDYPADNLEEITGERVDRIVTYGSALSLRDGKPYLTLAYDFGSADKARANLGVMEDGIFLSADGIGQDDPVRVAQDGSFVVAEFEISGSDLHSVAFDLRNLYDW